MHALYILYFLYSLYLLYVLYGLYSLHSPYFRSNFVCELFEPAEPFANWR